ncbi:MAG: hypothetical protein ONB46_02840 [candidate division KSB1 bacterium]|nr:hypothetical protein [candidate division KSB1 bacterium]MDZ7364827.1 hypothetical protein [candidate division KSB1 bacterium]MDZ7402930.1 hypothetical protein [candidate division KSB1 bacterium]
MRQREKQRGFRQILSTYRRAFIGHPRRNEKRVRIYTRLNLPEPLSGVMVDFYLERCERLGIGQGIFLNMKNRHDQIRFRFFMQEEAHEGKAKNQTMRKAVPPRCRARE